MLDVHSTCTRSLCIIITHNFPSLHSVTVCFSSERELGCGGWRLLIVTLAKQFLVSSRLCPFLHAGVEWSWNILQWKDLFEMELEESKRETPVIQVFARLAALSHTALSVNSYLSPAKPLTQQNPLDRILCSSWKGRREETLRNCLL